MERHSKLSQAAHHFLIKLKNFLDSIGVSFQQFFANFQTINKNQISKLEFFRIISLLNIQTHNNFDPQQVFNELSNHQTTIDINYLFKLHSGELIGRKASEEKVKEKAREEEMQKKMIRIGIYKLQEFIKKHQNPSAFIAEFDQDGTMSLSKNQFNFFLLATDIRELSNKDIRRIVIEHIYKYFQPRKEITLKELDTFFKIKPQTKLNQPQLQPPHIPIFPNHNLNPNVKLPPNPRISPIKAPESKPQNITTNPFGKQKPSPQSHSNSLNHQKQQKKEIQNIDNHISNCQLSYPLAMRYYRQGDPSPSQHEYMQQLQQLLSKKNKYIDQNNPKINGQGKYINSSQIFKTQKYHMFQMASSVLVRQVSRIGIARQIQPKDIIQGSVGDCYFLSSIASIISIYPQLIAQRFLFDRNPSDYYAVKLFVDGQWKVIKTDDRFPCKGITPLYAKPHTQEIWVMLLEKCWAKVFGSYQAIESGSSKEGFTALTGAPSQIISHEKEKGEGEAIKRLEYAHGHKYVATVSGSQYLEGLGKAAQEKVGLVSGHAYSLLKTIRVGSELLVKLRNPWGKTTWKGRWSYQSNAWTAQLREKYNYKRNPEDGSFYMAWQDFQTYFGQIVVSKLNPTFLHTTAHIKTIRNKSGYLLMRVKTEGQYILSIYQQNKRKFNGKYTNFQNSPSRLIILRRDGNTLKYIASKSTQQSQVCSVDMQHLQPGEYIISAKVQWKFWESHELIVTAYGTDYTSIEPINRAIAPLFKQGLIKSYAKEFAGTGKVKNYEKYGINATCQTNFNIQTGIGFIRMINNSQKSYQSIQEMTIKGLKVIKPDKLPLVFKMAGKSEKTVGFFIKAGGYEYSSTERITY